MTVDELEFYDEIMCDDLFDGNDARERILIFSLPDYQGLDIMKQSDKLGFDEGV
jgi:hypothetical protein